MILNYCEWHSSGDSSMNMISSSTPIEFEGVPLPIGNEIVTTMALAKEYFDSLEPADNLVMCLQRFSGIASVSVGYGQCGFFLEANQSFVFTRVECAPVVVPPQPCDCAEIRARFDRIEWGLFNTVNYLGSRYALEPDLFFSRPPDDVVYVDTTISQNINDIDDRVRVFREAFDLFLTGWQLFVFRFDNYLEEFSAFVKQVNKKLDELLAGQKKARLRVRNVQLPDNIAITQGKPFPPIVKIGWIIFFRENSANRSFLMGNRQFITHNLQEFTADIKGANGHLTWLAAGVTAEFDFLEPFRD